MYHKDDTAWKDLEAIKMLESKFPPNFHTVLAAHYRERLQQVISKGLKYTAQYFFVRNNLRYHEKQR